MKILAIETSCDETSAAIVNAENGAITVKSNVVSSQIDLHKKWGGVVPNLAAREHTKNLPHVLHEALENAAATPNDIDLIAVTHGPGLIPALLVGTNAAKTLSYVWNKPLVGIHHIEGHVYANLIDEKEELHFPALVLVVSGGHTQLVLMKEDCDYDIIGETQDDAVGEAFDKAARILGLGYPGGPEISKQSEKADGSGPVIELPRPMLHSGDFHFSFSGLKTAVLYAVREYQKQNNLTKEDFLPQELVANMSKEFQDAAVEVLVAKTLKAAKKHNAKTILLAGGVKCKQNATQRT